MSFSDLSSTSEALSRRTLLGRAATLTAGTIAFACAPAGTPATTPAETGAASRETSAWETEWQELTTTAKQDGKVVLLTFTGAGYRKAIEEFEKAFPGVSVEHQTTPSGSVWIQKLRQEREANLYSVDVWVGPPNSALAQFKPDGGFDPVRPLIFRPDVTEEGLWQGGFSKRFLDTERQLAFGWELRAVRSVAINTDLVKETEIRSAKDVLDPKWKGRLMVTDVRLGESFLTMATLRKSVGDAAVKQLLIDQEPTFSRDPRQVVEGLVRGRFPIAIGVRNDVLQEFREQGLANHIKLLEIPEFAWSNSFGVFLINRAPHPNAAKLFINWFLTREGQTAFGKNIPTNSARTDLEPFDPNGVINPSVTYFDTSDEVNYGWQTDTLKHVTALVGG